MGKSIYFAGLETTCLSSLIRHVRVKSMLCPLDEYIIRDIEVKVENLPESGNSLYLLGNELEALRNMAKIVRANVPLNTLDEIVLAGVEAKVIAAERGKN